MNPTNLTQLSPNLDPGGPTRPKIRFKSGSFGFIKYIIVLDPNLNPEGQPDPTQPELWVQNRDQPEKMGRFFDPEGQPNPTQPELWVQNRVQPEKTGRTNLSGLIVFFSF